MQTITTTTAAAEQAARLDYLASPAAALEALKTAAFKLREAAYKHIHSETDIERMTVAERNASRWAYIAKCANESTRVETLGQFADRIEECFEVLRAEDRTTALLASDADKIVSRLKARGFECRVDYNFIQAERADMTLFINTGSGVGYHPRFHWNAEYAGGDSEKGRAPTLDELLKAISPLTWCVAA